MEFDGKNNKNSKSSNLKRRHGNGQGSLQMSKKSKTEMSTEKKPYTGGPPLTLFFGPSEEQC